MLLSAAIAAGCRNHHSTADAAEASGASPGVRVGTLSVTAFRFTGWHDDRFHYVPALSVAASASGRPVLVQRVDFTAEDAGARRLLKGVRYAAAPRVQPGGSLELLTDSDAADQAEIDSPSALGIISAFIFFTDDQGQSGVVSAAARVPDVSDEASLAAVSIRHFTVNRREHRGRFRYRPKLALAETSGRSRASIKKIVFELLDLGPDSRASPLRNAPDVPAGGTIGLDTDWNNQAPWFEFDSSGEAARVSVVIAFVDQAGRGGLVSAVAAVQR